MVLDAGTDQAGPDADDVGGVAAVVPGKGGMRPRPRSRHARAGAVRCAGEAEVVVVAETSLPPRTAETIAREAGVKVVEGADAPYGDSLGPTGSDGDTYLKMIRHNTATIVSNLSGA
jgi:Zinc-uptake complex component A periplasmic